MLVFGCLPHKNDVSPWISGPERHEGQLELATEVSLCIPGNAPVSGPLC
jgi:hypothetical protein